MALHQRLIVCLDGTWNRQDSSTNVLHHFNLVCEGMVPGTDILQQRLYHLGVGTGVLDSITGGGLGLGLEANVRDAYDWLVEKVHDYKTDEIYIFGFSRGAYTARSLVGFIGQCGLLRRGAPITVEQLWRDYCVLGRQKEERKSIWEKILGNEQPTVRSYTTVEHEKKAGRQITADEQLLLDWSSRVRITYLGVYDTVGAIGLDALAIPGLTSRMALHNNVRPTTLIQHCRHALAIDEHRANFNHTPFVAYLSEDSEELQRVEGASQRSIEQNRAMWERKIEQRWFVGAHSNIGGGYPNNRLAQRAFAWLMEGAIQCGLYTEPLPKIEPLTPADTPVDSYAKFLPPVWETILRNKRNFRVIGPAPRLKARRDGARPGFALETIHETIDDSVSDFWKDSGKPIPPNLYCYWTRDKKPLPKELTPAAHTWLRENWFAYAALVIWTVTAVFGAYALDSLGGFTNGGLPFLFACAAAAFLPLIDWSESRVTFGYAVGAGGPRARAFLDAVYWTRTLGFVLFLFGAVYGVCVFFAAGLRQEWPVSADFVQRYWPVAALAALPALLITKLRSKFAWIAVITGPAGVALMGALFFGLGFAIRSLFPKIEVAQFWGASEPASLAGRLLLLQLVALYFWRALAWAAEPLDRANLGSITKLQQCFTPRRVIDCLDRWKNLLSNTTKPEDSPEARPTLVNILRESLWRDMIGFIPVYTVFLLFGLNFATMIVERLPSGTIRTTAEVLAPFWWVLPLLAAATDYLEDLCHLRYCRLYEKQQPPPAPVTLFSFSATLIKDVSFSLSALIAVSAMAIGTYVILPEVADWRAKVAVLLTGAAILAALLGVIATILGAVRRKRTATASPPARTRAAAGPA